ncbi:MAG: N-acetylmuramoyl-L-alanine amidase [Elusimicrobiota bacterium]|nr:MAG: N-acetylmuramoyl-L-alanine amidase [Elusimicrobiota bacterium]
MRRLTAAAVALALPLASGCDPNQQQQTSTKRDEAPARRAAERNERAGRELMAYAPATDFTGAAPETAADRLGAMFDGNGVRDAVADPRLISVAHRTGPDGRKRIPYTAASSERRPVGGVVPPLPDDYDYSKSGATPGTAAGAGETLLGFARFQLEQKFATVAPIMSRAGWKAAPRKGSNVEQTPYRVTVHHTQGHRPMSEAEAAKSVKGTQWYHMVGRGKEGKDNFSDIGYHFLIAGDGRVIEGRKAEYLGAHAGNANRGNIGVAMMGDFNKLRPTDAQVESLTRLVTFLSVKYKKDPASKGFLEGHQHYNSTDCPGLHMMEILDSLRRKIDRENEMIMAGDRLGTADGDFQPLAVVTNA